MPLSYNIAGVKKKYSSQVNFMVLLYLMQTRFYIERRKDEEGNLMMKERPVFMSVSIHGDRLMLSTGIKADFHGWDPELQRMKSSYPGSHISNSWLDTLEETAQKTWNALKNLPVDPDSDRFRDMFQEMKPRYSAGFFEVFYLFIESGSSRWSTATFQKVRTIFKHLREFEDQTGYNITFRSLDEVFLSKFRDFYAEKGNRGSTTFKAVNIIVWFMNWATEHDYNVNLDYRRFYKLLGQDLLPDQESGITKLHPYLQWDELMKLGSYGCRNKRSEWVRDLFCFTCYTGLRYSELQSLKKEDVGKDEITVTRQNRKVRRIPLNKLARDIHRSYENRYYMNNTAFPTMSIITFNKYLRLLGKEVGLNRMVESDELWAEKVPLYERLTAGTAINTFIYNALELEIPAAVISGFTGVQRDSRLHRIKMDLARKEISKFDGI
jgi:integrase